MKHKPRKPGPQAMIRHELSGFLITEVAAIYGMTEASVSQWECPREKAGTLNLGEVIRWREAKVKEKPSDKTDLEKDKLRLQCQKMEIEIEALKAENIPLETHKQIMAGRAMSLKNFIVEFFAKNCHQLAHKSIDQIRPQLQEWAAAMLNHYSSNHR
jgi:transposase